MILSKNFTLEELTTTSTTANNEPNEAQLEKLLYLTNFILQPIRNKFGAIRINSGFRSSEVNTLVNGNPHSQHMKGEAADIFPLESDIDIVFQWIRMYLPYGQVIKEQQGDSKWIHVSLPRIGGVNMQALLFKDGEYRNA